ncbi:Hypothetical predicted protein [Octopus vulgaris]|uniref:Transmembrane protein n=1 Tax=Octopus vulgaris TaxID=6645 RepID=A0AA36BM89_OCTVU|nr:Hypothetical predicted protein [Octopus vulgaris]
MEKSAIGCRNNKRLIKEWILCDSAAWRCDGTLTRRLTQRLNGVVVVVAIVFTVVIGSGGSGGVSGYGEDGDVFNGVAV